MIIETLWLRIDPDGNSKSVGMIYNEVLRVLRFCPKLESLLCAFRQNTNEISFQFNKQIEKRNVGRVAPISLQLHAQRPKLFIIALRILPLNVSYPLAP